MLDPGAVPMDEPLAYFITWTTYGTWLPGDERGWVEKGRGHQAPNQHIERAARRWMRESPCLLGPAQRDVVETTIRAHCEIRGWHLWAVNCRTNHVHVVVTARERPAILMNQFKAWCTRRLKENGNRDAKRRKNWWTEDGSKRFLNDEASLEGAVRYVVEGQ